MITEIVEEPKAGGTATGHSGNAAGTFSFGGLFGRSTPPWRG
ncbi:hypothetical protein ACWDCO_30805 [Streptomyces albogriseolus]